MSSEDEKVLLISDVAPPNKWVSKDQERLIVTEIYDMERFERVLQNEKRVKKVIKESSSKQEGEEAFRFAQIQDLGKKIRANGSFDCCYTKSATTQDCYGIGRFYSLHGIGLQGVPKSVRGYITKGKVIDVDMVNAHPTILEYLCTKHSILYPNLSQYNNNREAVLKDVATKLAISRGEAKTRVLAVLNGGTKGTKPGQGSEFLANLKKECAQIAQKLKDLGITTHLEEQVISKPKKTGFTADPVNRMMINHVGDLENEILFNLFNILQEFGFQPSTIMFDGLFVLLEDEKTEEKFNSMKSQIEEEILKRTEIPIKLDVKPRNTLLDFLDEEEEEESNDKTLNDIQLRDIFIEKLFANDIFKMMPDKSVYRYTDKKLWVFSPHINDIGGLICEMLIKYISKSEDIPKKVRDSTVTLLSTSKGQASFLRFLVNQTHVFGLSLDECDKFRKDLNGTPYCFSLQNGMMFDCKTMKLRERVKEDYATFELPYKINEEYFRGVFSNDETRERWNFIVNYVKSLASNYSKEHDPEMETTLRSFIGAKLSGVPSKHVFFLVGRSNTGKTTFQRLRHKVFGEYCRASKKTLITKTKSLMDNDKQDLSGGFRDVSLSELAETDEIDPDKTKAIADGGKMPIRTSIISNGFIEIRACVDVSSNEIPSFNANDTGILTRFKFLPFRSCFGKFDGDFEAHLYSHDTEFFHYALMCVNEFFKNGFSECSASLQEKKESIAEKKETHIEEYVKEFITCEDGEWKPIEEIVHHFNYINETHYGGTRSITAKSRTFVCALKSVVGEGKKVKGKTSYMCKLLTNPLESS